MFTGLVEALGTVTRVARGGDVTEIRVACPFAAGLNLGDSVCVSGVCVTVAGRDGASFRAQLTEETMRVSRFGVLTEGERVNLERALPVDGRLGGHIVAGHVDGTGLVMALKKTRLSARLWISVPENLARYVARKGSVCVDGVSLTVADAVGTSFSVAVIPETLSRTTLGWLRAGKSVNIETDMIARYVERLLGLGAGADGPAPSGGLTMEKLARMGW